ncbi:MAG: class I SAM-dependent RNA methyltransferase [Anaerolineae bacterium]|nr:class I SAM-dependent RNA methyltransferase [Anaerolineae bacterium]
MAKRTQETFEIEIDGMAQGGFGVGRQRGRPVFVPYTIPGERVAVRVKQPNERILHAEGVRLLESSGDRVYPRCPHFGPGQCWRCQWQHVDYPAQLLLKQDITADQLERLGGIVDDVVQAVIPSPEQWAYNHHMTFSPIDEASFGLPAADGRNVAIDTCSVLHPDLLALYKQLDFSLPGLRRMKLQIGSDGAAMIVLYLNDEEAPELETDLDASINLLLPNNEPVNLIGDSHSRYRVHDRDFRVTAGSYYRANAPQVPALVNEVLKLADLRGDEFVLDLYGGVGVFSAFLAQQAKLVTLVESYPPAATDAEVNLTPFDNVDVIEGTAENALSGLDGEYEVAVVDPPGVLHDDVIDGLRGLNVQRLVYVSGDMSALARDCKRLSKAGYRLVTVQPLDFAPQTYHVDAAALFVQR